MKLNFELNHLSCLDIWSNGHALKTFQLIVENVLDCKSGYEPKDFIELDHSYEIEKS